MEGVVIDANISVDDTGSGVVRVGTKSYRFPHMAFLTSDIARRNDCIGRAAAAATLTTTHEWELKAIGNRVLFSDQDFIAAGALLSATPETFARQFRDTLRATGGTIGEGALLPDDVGHWENLTAALEGSPDLNTFIQAELATERKRQLHAHAARAYRAVSLSLCASELVPKQLLDGLELESVVAMIEGVLELDDPFALVGSFEYCAASLQRDKRFVALGTSILDRIVGDMDRLQRATGIWATAFVIATAHLSMDIQTRGYPAFWRRLAAAAHASLVVRTSGVPDEDPSEFLRWAVRMRGVEFQCSVLFDMPTEPRWRPEWVDPSFVTADVVGRALGALETVPKELVPAPWTELISKARAWIDEQKLTPFMFLPSVLQGALHRTAPPIDQMNKSLGEIFRRFIDDPQLDNLIPAVGASQTFGVPPEMVPAMLEALGKIRKGTATFDDPKLRRAMDMCAHVAVLTADAALVDAVVQTILDCARGITDRQGAHDSAFRIIEASRALQDEAAGQALLCQGLVALSNILPPNDLLADLAELLDALIRVRPDLAMPLGRVIHTARLGAPSCEL